MKLFLEADLRNYWFTLLAKPRLVWRPWKRYIFTLLSFVPTLNPLCLRLVWACLASDFALNGASPPFFPEQNLKRLRGINDEIQRLRRLNAQRGSREVTMSLPSSPCFVLPFYLLLPVFISKPHCDLEVNPSTVLSLRSAEASSGAIYVACRAPTSASRTFYKLALLQVRKIQRVKAIRSSWSTQRPFYCSPVSLIP